MSENDPHEELDEAKQDADEDLGELDDAGDDMEERLEENEDLGEQVEVPEPGQGNDLSISAPEDKEAAGVGGGEDESPVNDEGIPEDEGEAAAEAGQ